MSEDQNKRRSLIGEVAQRIGDRVVVLGRVYGIRDHGKLIFVDIVDRSGICQAVTNSSLTNLAQHCVVKCSGVVRKSDRAFQGVEIEVDSIDVLSSPTAPLPIQPGTRDDLSNFSDANLETLLDNRILSLRSLFQQFILKVVSHTLGVVSSFLRERDFVEIKTPKLVGGGTEGGSGLFEVRYFERLAYLVQSPQLYKQALASTPIERVFEIGPAFRAEKHSTGRHLNEFISMDVEMAYPACMNEIMDLLENMIRCVLQQVQGLFEAELSQYNIALPQLGKRIPRIRLSEAKETVTGVKPTRSDPALDLNAKEEQDLCHWSRSKHGSDAVFVHSYPASSRPFYTMAESSRGSTLSFDLLVRGLEVSSGAIREHELGRLEQNLERSGVSPESLRWYLDVFRYGCPPHGGFGVGVDRLVQGILNLPNVRWVTAFPRDLKRLQP